MPHPPVSIGRVTPSVRACLAACLVTGLVALPGAAAEGSPRRTVPASAAPAQNTPLQVSIDSLTPSTIPANGRLTVTGDITNRSEDTWSDLNVYLLTSDQPMTTSAEVVLAHATDSATEIGARITTPGLYDEVADLEPGESTGYRLSVPRSALSVDEAGVYWLGVHVLGETEDGRVDGADGRARTFIPLMPDDADTAEVALVLPVREPVVRRRLGRLAGLDRWQAMLADDGRLGRLADFGASAGGAPLTWLVDPAVLQAASSVARDNPPLSRGPTDGGTDPSGSPSPSPSEGETGETAPEPAELSPEARVARAWLDGFAAQARDDDLLTLPYGDLDVASVLRSDAVGVYTTAVDLAAHTVGRLDLEAQPVVAPRPGVLPPVALDALDSETPLILSESAVGGSEAGVVELPSGHQAVLTSDEVAAGGPAPGPADGALALRQRILAEAAVHSLSGPTGQPLVVSTPQQWDPGEDWRLAGFFTGLDVPWLRLQNVSTAVTFADPAEHDGPLTYPRTQRRREIAAPNILSTQELADTGAVFGDLLDRNDQVDEQVGKAALLASSIWAREQPRRFVARARATSRHLHSLMDQVRIESSRYVTLSSEDGIFAVTVINGLDEPVTVGIDVNTGTDSLTVSSPDAVSLGPDQRATVRLNVTASEAGVNSVTLAPVTRGGLRIGDTEKVNIRSSQVGLVIWLVMGVGAAVFVVAVFLRVRGRLAVRRSTRTQTTTAEQA